MVLSSSANLYIKTRMSSMYNCDSVAVLNYYRRNNPHKPTKKTAHFYVFCGLQKLNTLNLRLFHSPSNPRNHFSTVLIETNWYTTSCKYQYCSGLLSIFIGSGINYILSWAFQGCNNFDDFYCLAKNIPTLGSNVFKDSYYKYATLHVPSSSVKAYRSTAPWSEFGNIVALTEEETGIEALRNYENEKMRNDEDVYDLSGRKLSQIQRGINIVRMKDGTTKKVLVK